MIYFAQPSGGGPIKVGQSSDARKRKMSLQALFPYGIDLLAEIPGQKVGERFLHSCLAPFATSQEWFKAGPIVWRVALEAIDHRKLSWLPPEDKMSGDDLREAVMSAFGDEGAARRALGYQDIVTFGNAFRFVSANGYGLQARYEFAMAVKLGRLPDYLMELHSEDVAEAA